MNQPTIDSKYVEVERMIGMLVDMFRRQYGGDRDEILSDANLAFVRAYHLYDANIAKFSTYLWHKVWLSLKRERAFRIKKGSKTVNVENFAKTTTIQKAFNFSDFMKHLTKDACIVTQMALETPNDLKQIVLFKNNSPNWRETIRKHLLSIGWTIERVRESFAEIKAIL